MSILKATLITLTISGIALGGTISGRVTDTGTMTDTAFVIVFHNYASLMDSGLFYTSATPPLYNWMIDTSGLIDDYDYNAMAIIMTGLAPMSGDPAGQYPGNPFRLRGGIATGIDIPLATRGNMHGHITYSGSVSVVKIDIFDAYWIIFGLPPLLESTNPITSFNYSLYNIPAGPKNVRAFADLNYNNVFDSLTEPFGWHTNPNGGMVPIGGGCTTAVNITITTGLTEPAPVPSILGIRCIPNPFNGVATILIAGDGEPITVKMHDLSGREIATIYDNGNLNGLVAVRYTAPEYLPSGKYLLVAKSGFRTITKEIIYIK